MIAIKFTAFGILQAQSIWQQLKGQNSLIKVPHQTKQKLAMESSSSNTRNVPLFVSQRPLHVTDADEEDESVKQLNDCATINLSLQALASLLKSQLFPSIPILGLSDFDLIVCSQDCLVESNRNWKACQARKSSNIPAQFYLLWNKIC